MELFWYEELLITALRVIYPFFDRKCFYIRGLIMNSRDGDYIEYSDLSKSIKITFILNPGFDIRIASLRGKSASLVEERLKYPQFQHLKENFKGIEELEQFLKEYLVFLEVILHLKYEKYLPDSMKPKKVKKKPW